MIGEILTFKQPSIIKREFELVSSKGVLATMVFPKLFSNRVILEGFDAKWEIKQPSIWRREYGVFKYGYQMPFAKYISNFWRTKGTLELPRGARLYCKSAKFKKPFDVFSSDNKLLLSYSNRFVLMGKTSVTIEQRSELLDKYPWVILLGWYVIVQNRKGRASAAG